MYNLYFDPGLGAMLAQAAIAAFAGIVLFYKTVLSTVKGWFGIKPKDTDNFDEIYKDEEDKA